MAQFAVLIHAPGSAREETPSAGDSPERAHDEHADALAAEGAMVGAWALMPPHEARTVRATGVTDGPYAESAEAIAGFYLLEAPDLESAVTIAARNPAVAAGGGVEVREVQSGGLVER